MNVKRFLLQLYKLECLIKEHIDQIEHLRMLAQKTTNVLSREPRAQLQGDKLCSLVAKIVDLQQELNEQIDKFIDHKRLVLQQIAKLENTKHKTVLMARYVNFKTWPAIALLLDCDKRHALRVHDLALEQLEQIMQKEQTK